MKEKFKKGDRVRVVKYGSLFWENKKSSDPKMELPVIHETEDVIWKDMSPELVGQKGVVEGSYSTIYCQVNGTKERQGKYLLYGIVGKSAWYDEEQLELCQSVNNLKTMTKLFFDTEFTGLHQKTTIISLGIVAESGETFYAEFTDYDKTQVDDWIRDNVISKLTYKGDQNLDFAFDYSNQQRPAHTSEYYSKTSTIKSGLEKWLSQFDQVQMWGDCLAYDWVLFCQIFGHAFNIPKNIYYIPFDICPLLLEKTGNADVGREEYAESILSVGTKTKHNALWDAHVIRACYNKLRMEDEEFDQYLVDMGVRVRDNHLF